MIILIDGVHVQSEKNTYGTILSFDAICAGLISHSNVTKRIYLIPNSVSKDLIFTSISASVGYLHCFPTFFYDS